MVGPSCWQGCFFFQSSKQTGHAFFEHDDPIFDACACRFLRQQLQGLFNRFVGKAEGAVVHGHHPAGIQIEKGSHRVLPGWCERCETAPGCRPPIGSNASSGDSRCPISRKPEKIRGIAGVIHGVFAGAKNVPAVAAMGIFDNARSPVAGWHMRDVESAMAIGVPPLQFHDVFKTKIGNQVKHMMGNDQRGRCSTLLARQASDGPQRMPV